MRKSRTPKVSQFGIPGETKDVSQKTARRRYVIKSDLLRACIGHVTHFPGKLNNKDELLLFGFQAEKEGRYSGNRGFFGYPFLCLFLEDQFGLTRIPHCQDRIINKLKNSPYDYAQYQEYIRYFGEDLIKEAALELRTLYEFTQLHLLDLLPNQDSITLCRGVSGKYADKIIKCVSACQSINQPSFCLEADILNSYSDDAAYNDRNLVVLTQRIPFSQVLYCDEFIADHGTTVSEDGEWVVMNGTQNGLIQLNVDDVQFHDQQKCLLSKYLFKLSFVAKLHLKFYNPYTRERI